MNIGIVGPRGTGWNIEVKQSRPNSQEELDLFLHLVEIAFINYGKLTVFSYN